MLFLVDNHQPQLLEFGLFRQQRVGADDDVDLTRLEPLASLLDLGRRDQPRQPPDLDRETLEALGEVGEMLAHQQSCRRDHRDLIAAHRRDERGAQGDLGLAEPDVAAHQAVHRLARLQIVEHVGNRPVLIVGLLIREAVDERGITVVGLDQPPGPGRAQGGGLDQLARNLADALLHPALAPLPRLPAQPVERGALAVRAVARQNVDILDRNVKLVPSGVGQRDAIVRRAPDHDRGQPLIFGDAVLGVDDEVARGQRGQFGEEGVGALSPLLAPDQPVAEHVLLGHHRDIGCGEAMVERQHDQPDVCLRPERFLPRPHLRDRFQPMILEQPRQPFARARAIARQHDFDLVLP